MYKIKTIEELYFLVDCWWISCIHENVTYLFLWWEIIFQAPMLFCYAYWLHFKNTCWSHLHTYQPKTHTFECVLVQVGGWGLHVVGPTHDIPMYNSNHSIGMNMKHTTLIQMGQGQSTEKYSKPFWLQLPTITQQCLKLYLNVKNTKLTLANYLLALNTPITHLACSLLHNDSTHYIFVKA